MFFFFVLKFDKNMREKANQIKSKGWNSHLKKMKVLTARRGMKGMKWEHLIRTRSRERHMRECLLSGF